MQSNDPSVPTGLHLRRSCHCMRSARKCWDPLTYSAGPPLSELSHQSCPFQEGYLRIFSVTFLQITCTCFPARFLVTIIFQQLSFQLMTGQNTSCPTTLRAPVTAGRENVLWSGKGDTNGLVLQQQRNDHAIRQNHFCAMTTRLFRSIEICYSYQCYSFPGNE